MEQKSLSKTKTGLVLLLCLIAMLVIDYFSRFAFDAFIFCLTYLATSEFGRLLFKAGYPSFKYAPEIVAGLMFVLFVIGVLCSFGAVLLLALEIALIVVSYGVFFVLSFWILRKRTQNDDFRLATNMSIAGFSLFKSNNTLVAIFYPSFLMLMIYFINHITELGLSLNTKVAGVPYSLFGIVMLFSIACLTDTFAMAFGLLIKGKKIFPKISPKKTISGAIFGLIGGVIGAVATYYAFMLICGGVFSDIAIWKILTVGILGAVVAQLGDLFESYIKRRAGVQDSGDFFRSHGGVLDRFDSIILLAPYMFLCLLIMVA